MAAMLDFKIRRCPNIASHFQTNLYLKEGPTKIQAKKFSRSGRFCLLYIIRIIILLCGGPAISSASPYSQTTQGENSKGIQSPTAFEPGSSVIRVKSHWQTRLPPLTFLSFQGTCVVITNFISVLKIVALCPLKGIWLNSIKNKTGKIYKIKQINETNHKTTIKSRSLKTSDTSSER